MKILITGSAGFIGFHLSKKLIERKDEVIGLDNINDYYDVNLKFGRLEELGIDRKDIEYNKLVKSKKFNNFSFIKLNLEDREGIFELFKRNKFDKVCNLAAQAGVRYSLENPFVYIDSNIVGYINILEASRHFKIKDLCYASSSSVYGLNKKMPFSTKDNVDHPISLYAATKKSNELMSHTYSYLYNLPTTGLRFFTVYGPWGRPDMALFRFVKNILEDKEIEVYNNGDMKRDFTYIDDIINGMIKVINNPPDSKDIQPPYKIYNIGNGSPINLMDFIHMIEHYLNKKAKIKFLPMQPGDVKATWADTFDLEKDFNYKPFTPIKIGIKNFIKWYKKFYKVRGG